MDAKGVKPSEADAIVVPCPQIIGPDLIAHAAAIRAKAAPAVTAPRTTNSPVLLGGLATCGHPGCNAGMVIRSGKGAPRAVSCATALYGFGPQPSPPRPWRVAA